MELAEQLMRPPSADAMGFVNELGRPVLHSNSIKLTNVDFSGPRWLITLPDVDHPTSLSDAVIGAVSKYCKTDASAFIRRFDSRTALHVGYAEEKGQAIRKLYVEYTDAEGNPAYEAVKVSSSVSEFHHYRSTKVDETLMHLDLPEETLSHVQTLIASVRSEISVLEVKSRSSSRISMDVNISDRIVRWCLMMYWKDLGHALIFIHWDQKARRHPPTVGHMQVLAPCHQPRILQMRLRAENACSTGRFRRCLRPRK